MAGCYGGSSEDRYYENMLNKYLDKGEEQVNWIESRKKDLLETDCDPYQKDNIIEALENGRESMRMFMVACLQEANAKGLKDDHANHLALVAIAKLVEEYWEDAADKQAEKDWENR